MYQKYEIFKHSFFLLYTSLLIGQNTYLRCEKLFDIQNGADMIKISAAGGVLSMAKNGLSAIN
jgi:hypothetical protein